MAYIGKQPAIGNFVKLDAISTSSTNSYSLTLDSVAFVPESANHMLVSLNGVIQSPNTSFQVSSSTITFLPSSGTLSSSDSIDFIMVYGNVLDIGTPSDSTVTNAKTNFVSTSSAAGLQIKGDNTTAGTLQLNCEQNSHGIKLRSPAHSASQSYTLTFPTTAPSADKFLKTDGSGNLSFADASSDFVHISTTTTSGASSVSLTGLDSTYKNYKIFVNDCLVASGNAQLRFRFINSSGDITSSSYYFAYDGVYKPYNSTNAALLYSLYNADFASTAANFDISNNNTNASSLEMTIPNPSDASGCPHAFGTVLTDSQNGSYMMISTFAGKHTATGAITGVKFYSQNGNNISGNFSLYGIKG